uniref:MADS70 n=1 Tax=Bambusa oldhamii TaxID=58923 RepID=A0A3S6K9H7_BAMOL|nr:MADS70 [Bambusa oldhamii]
MAKGKSTMGRQKIEIKPIESKEARQVCFSKRRPSVFKKASELSILCGAEVAVVVFSPGGNCFSFGHPSVNSVTDRFLAMGDHAMGVGSHGGGVVDTVHEMNRQLAELQQLMGAENQRKERVQEALERESGGRVMQWVSTDVRALGLDELEEFHKELAALQGMVNGKVYQVLQDAKHTKKPLQQSHMYTASASPFLSGGKSVTRPTPMSTTLHGSTYGLYEWLDVNSMFNGSQMVGGSDNFFNGQFGG